MKSWLRWLLIVFLGLGLTVASLITVALVQVPGFIVRVAIHPDEKQVVTLMDNGVLQVWHPSTS